MPKQDNFILLQNPLSAISAVAHTILTALFASGSFLINYVNISMKSINL